MMIRSCLCCYCYVLYKSSSFLSFCFQFQEANNNTKCYCTTPPPAKSQQTAFYVARGCHVGTYLAVFPCAKDERCRNPGLYFMRQQLMRHNRTRLGHSHLTIIHKYLTCVQNNLRPNQKSKTILLLGWQQTLYKRCVLDNPAPLKRLLLLDHLVASAAVCINKSINGPFQWPNYFTTQQNIYICTQNQKAHH